MRKVLSGLTLAGLLLLAAPPAALAQDGAQAVFAANDQAVAANAEGRMADAIKRGREALELSLEEFGADSMNTVTITANLGNYLMAAGDLAGARPLFQSVLAGYRQLQGEDASGTISAQYDLAELTRQQGRLAEALMLFTDMLERSDRVLGPEDGLTILAANGLGITHLALGDFDAAAPLLRRVIALEVIAGPQVISAALGNLAELERLRGNYVEAEQLLLRILPNEMSNPDDLSPDDLVTLQSLAAVRLAQGKFAEAESLFHRSGDAAQKLLGAGHPLVLQFRGNHAALLIAIGRALEAERLLSETRTAAQAALGADHPTTLLVANNLATVYRDQGRFSEAESLFKDLLEKRERVLGFDHPDTLETAGNLAVVYIDEERYALAGPLLRRSVPAAEAKLGPDHASTLTQLGNLAVVLARTDRLSEAERLYLHMLEAYVRTLGENHPRALTTTGNLARVLARQGRVEEAAPLYRAAFDGAERALGMQHPQTIAAATNYADYLGDTGNGAEADAIYARGLKANVATFGPDHPVTTNIAAFLALLRLREGQAAQAVEPARLAASGLRARRDLRQKGNRSSAGEETKELRDNMLHALLADADWAAGNRDAEGVAEAFIALQDAMAGITDEAVARMAVRRFAELRGRGLAELTRENDELVVAWQAADAAFSASLARTGPAALAQRDEIRRELTRIEARRSKIEMRIGAEFPEYFALTRNAAIGLKDLQSVLAPDEAVLLLVPTPLGTHSMALTRDGGRWFRSDVNAADMAQAVERLLWDVGANVDVPPEVEIDWEEEGGPGYPFDRTTAYNIYRQLIEPVNEALAGKRHVFVTAAGSLSSLPLSLLVTAPPEGTDGDPVALRATRWFGDAHALTQIPSVQSLLFLRAAERVGGPSEGSFLGFGDPALGGKGMERSAKRGSGRGARGIPQAAAIYGEFHRGEERRLADPAAIARLSRLPGTARELEAIRKALGAPAGSVHLGSEATESAVRSMDLSGTRILALATHGVLAGELETAEPGLVFTPPAAASPDDDGLLTTSEITTLRLDADWVILSACNTAAGDGSEGAPGLSGLARAFFYAGARALLASHWPVRDDVAALLTVRSLELESKDGLSRAEALQRAMREIRDDPSHDSDFDSWAHPNAWAPFTLIGDGAR